MQACLRAACTPDGADAKLSAAQAKELLKLALAGVRHTRRVAPARVRDTWDPPSWDALADELAKAERLAGAQGLPKAARQVALLAGKEEDGGKVVKKRKAAAVEGEGAEGAQEEEKGAEEAHGEAAKKPKRKKQKASKSA